MSFKNKQIKDLSKLLKLFLSMKDMEKRFNVKIPVLPDFCDENEFSGKTDFTNNLKLKDFIKREFKKIKNDEKMKMANWIVSDWGGLPAIQNGIRKNLIETDIEKFFSDKSDKIEISLSKNEYVSPRSKVLSFMDPEKFAICDSRVIFSLNWLLFITRDNELIQFHKLPTRNRICKAYSIEYIQKKFPELKKPTLLSDYSDVLDLLKKLTAEMKKSQKEWNLASTEMLLFQLADDLDKGLPYLIRESLLSSTGKKIFSLENSETILNK